MMLGSPCWACGRLVQFEKSSSIAMHASSDGGRATFSVDVCGKCFGATLDFMKRRREHIRAKRRAKPVTTTPARRALPKGKS